MRISNPTYGSDIEFFIQTLKGDPIPAIGMVGGTKDKPKPLGGQYFIQEDNVAVEFNIPICKSPKDFTNAVLTGYRKCMDVLPRSVVPLGGVASIEFDMLYLQNPQAMEFGCEPDINGWTRRVNPRPKADNMRLRSAGGHVHIGWDNPDMETRFDLIRACDVFAGIPSVTEDKDTRRRELYGKAGAMRIKPYGVEHRLLSNYWLFDPAYTGAVITRYKRAIDFLNYGHVVDPNDADKIVEAINNGDRAGGKRLLQKYTNLLMESELAQR